MWYNWNGITNLLYIPQLDKDGYKVKTHTTEYWVVITPSGNEIFFKQDTGFAEGMLYIELREQHKGFVMMQTI